MNLKGANAGCQIEDTGKVLFFQARHQDMDTEAQFEVEDEIAIFDEQVLVAGATRDDAGQAVLRIADGDNAVVGAEQDGIGRCCGGC